MNLAEGVRVHNARVRITHCRPRHWLDLEGVQVPAYVDDASGMLVPGRRWVAGPSGDPGAEDRLPDPRDVEVVGEEETHNVKTTAGIDSTPVTPAK